MKRFLLSVLLVGTVIFGRAQVVLNELFTSPPGQEKQFFELYNTGLNAVNLDCYTIVSVATTNQGVVTDFYVLDLPNVSIDPGKFFVGAAGSPAKSGGVNYTPNLNWNAGATALSAIGASFTKYTPSGTRGNGGYAATTISGTNDFLIGNSGSGKYYIFLFNNGIYVNGFLGGGASSTVPANISGMATIPNLTNACGTYSLNWSAVQNAEFVNKATGNSHGYARGGNGMCGTWDKETSTITPGTSNPVVVGSNGSGSVTTNENIVCNNTFLAYKITAADVGVLPVKVELYYDVNGDGAIDPTEFQASNTVSAVSNTNVYTFDITNKPTGQNAILAYKSSLGCISEVVTVTEATLGITTTQNTICGTKVGFTISGSKADSTFVTPIEVGLYVADPNNPGFLPADTLGKQVGNAIVNTLTTTDGTTYSASGVIDLLPAGQNQPIIVVYKKNYGCFQLAPIQALPVDGVLNTTQSYSCGKTITYTITPAQPPAAISLYSLPLDVKIVEDLNFNGEIDEDTTKGKNILGTALVTSYTNGVATGTITLSQANEGKQILVAYQTPYGCLNPAVVTPTYSGRIDIGAGFTCTPNANGKRTANYFLNNSTTDADAYPITLYLYEDANRNGIIDQEENTVIGTKTISTAPAPGTPNNTDTPVELANVNSYIIVKGVGAICSIERAISSSCELLPVKFASFTAARNKSNKGVVNLKWETASEQNNRGFNVQRLTNGAWKTIAFVFSQATNGNSSSLLGYEYRDANTERGITQYRIQQVDLDDKASFSEVRSVMGLEQAAKMMVFPNPSNTGTVTVLFSSPSVREVIVSDVSGRIIKQYQSVTGTSLEIHHLPAGFFAVKVVDGATGAESVEKVIIQQQ